MSVGRQFTLSRLLELYLNGSFNILPFGISYNANQVKYIGAYTFPNERTNHHQYANCLSKSYEVTKYCVISNYI